MSLRVFHMVFIAASLALSLFCAVWGIRLYAGTGSGMGLATGIAFAAIAMALVLYGARAFHKLKELA
ncbi:MAG TPA: hypothetical protein VIL97_07450 [Thermoanaerobaculia bacterium]